MPLPLAHPAAVLPLRRFCPRYLALPARMIGSLAPDFADVADYVRHFSKVLVAILGGWAREFDAVLLVGIATKLSGVRSSLDCF